MTAIETVRLVLRPLGEGDVTETYLSWMQDPEVVRHLESRFAEHSLDSIRAFVRAATASPTTHLFAIVDGDERHIGNIKLEVDVHHRRADIGIMIGARDAWGQGYGSEAIEALARWAFEELDVDKLTAGAYVTNVGSVRAFERAGFTVEATRRAHSIAADGARVDVVLLARLA